MAESHPDAATLDDVKTWFKTWYGPSNAVLVLACDITVEQARAKAEKYFGDMPPGPELERPTAWPAQLKQPARLAIADEVVGALSQISAPIGQLGLGEVQVLQLSDGAAEGAGQSEGQ